MFNAIRYVLLLAVTSLFSTLAIAQTIYTTHGDGTRFGTIEASTGAGTDIGATGQSQGWALARDTDGTLYTTYNGFSGDAQLATINPATGLIASTIGGLGTSLIALEIDSTGQLWGVGYNDQVLYRIDKSNAATTPVGSTGVNNTMDLGFDSAGNLYSTVNNVIYQLNTSTGASAVTTNITGISAGSVMGIMFGPGDVLYATAYVAASPLYVIDIGSGNATIVGATGFDLPHGGDMLGGAGVPSTPTAIPTMPFYVLVLTALGLVIVALTGLRRRLN